MSDAPKNWTADVRKDADGEATQLASLDVTLDGSLKVNGDTPITTVKQDFDEKGQPTDTHIKVGDTWYSPEKLHEKFPEFSNESWGTIKTKIESAYGEYATGVNKAMAFRGSVDNYGWKTQGLHKQADGTYTPDVLAAYVGNDSKGDPLVVRRTFDEKGVVQKIEKKTGTDASGEPTWGPLEGALTADQETTLHKATVDFDAKAKAKLDPAAPAPPTSQDPRPDAAAPTTLAANADHSGTIPAAPKPAKPASHHHRHHGKHHHHHRRKDSGLKASTGGITGDTEMPGHYETRHDRGRAGPEQVWVGKLPSTDASGTVLDSSNADSKNRRQMGGFMRICGG